MKDFVLKNYLSPAKSAIQPELECKEAEQLLVEAKEKYQRLDNFNQRILDNAPVSIMVIDGEGKIAAVNKFFLNFTGSTEPIGRCIYDVDFFKREKLVDSYKEIIKTGIPFSRLDCKTVNTRGETKFLNITAVPLRDAEGKIEGVVSMAIDNTEVHFSHMKLMELNRSLEKEAMERHAAERQVKILSEINQKILDNVPVSIVLISKSGEIIGANKVALQLMDTSGMPIIGQKLTETKEIKENSKLTGLFHDLLAIGRSFYYDNLSYIQESSGKRRYLNILAVPLIDSRGQIEGAVSMASDSTQAIEAKNNLRKMTEELEERVQERTGELDKINQRLTNVLDMKSKFVADASHELRTPLTVIQGNIDLAVAESEMNGNEAPEIYITILEEVERMRSVLADLAMLTDVDTNRQQINHEKVDLEEVLKSVERSMRVIANQKNIHLEFKESIHDTVIGDNAKLKKLLLNIVRNAIKYTNSGGQVSIKADKSDEGVLIFVEDNGIGIPKEDLPHIFERFYRVDKARVRDESGSGLGLSIAKWIAEAHGGTIGVSSELGKGSTFTIHLPFDCRKKSE